LTSRRRGFHVKIIGSPEESSKITLGGKFPSLQDIARNVQVAKEIKIPGAVSTLGENFDSAVADENWIPSCSRKIFFTEEPEKQGKTIGFAFSAGECLCDLSPGF
jgi:hypothetical protein